MHSFGLVVFSMSFPGPVFRRERGRGVGRGAQVHRTVDDPLEDLLGREHRRLGGGRVLLIEAVGDQGEAGEHESSMAGGLRVDPLLGQLQ